MSLQLFLVVWIFLRSLGVIVTTDEFSVRVTKPTSRISVSWPHSLAFCFWPVFNSINHGHIIKRMQNLALPIFQAFTQILLYVNPSLNQTLLTFLLCVGQTWMAQLILAISLYGVIFLYSERMLLLIYMICQFTWRKDCLLHGTYLQKTLQSLICVFNWLYFTRCLTSISSTDHLLCLYQQFIDSISSNTDEVLSIKPSAIVYVFWDFNVHDNLFWWNW